MWVSETPCFITALNCFQVVSSSELVLTFDAERGIVQGVRNGSARLFLRNMNSISSDMISVNDVSESPIYLDPVVSALRLNLETPLDSRLSSARVSLEILSSLFFLQERAEVSVSFVLESGRRVVITDPNELIIESSNASIVSVDGNFVVAEDAGMVELNVTWIVCDVVLDSRVIVVTVELRQNRPVFEDGTQTASVVENSPPNTVVATVFAIDRDFEGEDDPRIDTEYRFADESFSYDGIFTLNEVTGEVLLSGPIDRELRESYEIVIEATDREQRQGEQGSLTDGSASGSANASRDDDNPNVVVVTDPPDSLIVSHNRHTPSEHFTLQHR